MTARLGTTGLDVYESLLPSLRKRWPSGGGELNDAIRTDVDGILEAADEPTFDAAERDPATR